MIRQILKTPVERNARTIFRCDEILGANVKSSPRGTMGTANQFYDWAIEIEHFEASDVMVRVLQNSARMYNGAYSINGYLYLPGDLPVLISRMGFIGWRDVNRIIVGDEIYTDKGWLSVDKIDMWNKRCTMHEVRTDLYECYYINGVLAHNKKVSYAN